MRSRRPPRAAVALLLALILTGLPVPAVPQERSATETQLRQELDAMKEQLRRVEEQLKQQDELIRRLSGERPSAPPAAAAPAAVPPPVMVNDDVLRARIHEELEQVVQPQLAAANKTFPSQFNPAIGFVIDTVFSSTQKNKSNFEFRSGEMGISASVDPFVRGYAIINGTADGVEVEEAAIVTTSLPYGLTIKGGRFFAEFGRLSTFHDHDLPFVNRPLVLDTYIGGESQADGIEVNWLTPLPQYLTLTAGMYNKIGAENARVDNTIPRDLDQFTYLGRAATFVSLNDAHSLDIGISDAYTPSVKEENNKPRNLFGVDLTYRYTPLDSAAYRGLIWGTEFLLNHENRPKTVAAAAEDMPGAVAATGDMPTVPTVFKYEDAWGLYSYLEAKLTRRYYLGFLYQYVQDLDDPHNVTQAFSPYFTIWASEFQRLRLQYAHVLLPGDKSDDQFFLQWTVVLGSHVHGFRDR